MLYDDFKENPMKLFKLPKILFSIILITTFPSQAIDQEDSYVCAGMHRLKQICVQERESILKGNYIREDKEIKKASSIVARMCGSQGLLKRKATRAERVIYKEVMNYLAELQLLTNFKPLFQLAEGIAINPDTSAHIRVLKAMKKSALLRKNQDTFKAYYSQEFLERKPRSESQVNHIKRIWRNLPLAPNLQPARWESKERPQPWAPLTGKPLSATEPIYFQHGGGLIHILKALQGKSTGYRLEGKPSGRLGIQVSPFTKGSAVLPNLAGTYASDRLYSSFDYPAILVGYIERQYLDNVEDTDEEAGIRNEHLSGINVLMLQPLARSEFSRQVSDGCKVPILDQFLEEMCQKDFSLPQGLLKLYKYNRHSLAMHWKKASLTIPYSHILPKLQELKASKSFLDMMDIEL